MADSKMENGNDSHTPIASKSKLQPTIEYISTFAVALLLLAIVLAIVSITLFGNNGGQPPVQSSCFISVQLNCVQLQIANNGVVGSAVLVFANNLGVTIYFPSSNAIKVNPSGSQSSYVGNCYPANAVPGSTVICNATLTGYSPSIGSQLEPTFQIKYSQCAGCTQLNTSGSGTTYVSSPVSLYTVQLLSSSGVGSISVDGVLYPSGSTLMFVKGTSYSISETLPTSYTFSGWTSTGNNVVLSAALSSRAVVSTSSSGSIILQSVSATGTAVSCPSFSAGGTTICTVVVTGSSPTGTVSFTTSSGTGSFTTSNPCTLSSGSCVITYKDISAGTPTITATYSGNSNNAGSHGSTKVTVNKATSTTSVSCPSFSAGTTTTCTSTVTGTNPTGFVTLSTSSGTGSFTTSNPCTLSSGTCGVTYKDTVGGTPTITATYYGDPNNAGGTGTTTVAVTAAISGTVISCPAFAVGSTTTCTSTVTGTNPTGTITFTTTSGTGSFTTANPCTLASGSCTVAYKDTAVGSPKITATYSGDSSNGASNGNTIVTVNKATTTTSVSCPAFLAGGTTTCTATITGYNPTGTVSMSTTSGTGSFTTANPCTLSSGSCVITYKDTAAGVPTITATYSGDSSNSGGYGTGTVTVNKATSATSVSCPSFTAGGTTTCTATVTGSSPTGSVTMGTSSGTGSFTTSNPCTLSSGSCVIIYKDTAAGTPTITATYSGDSNNAGSVGTASVIVSVASSTSTSTLQTSSTTTLQTSSTTTQQSTTTIGQSTTTQQTSSTTTLQTSSTTTIGQSTTTQQSSSTSTLLSSSTTTQQSTTTLQTSSTTTMQTSSTTTLQTSSTTTIGFSTTTQQSTTTIIPPTTTIGYYTLSTALGQDCTSATGGGTFPIGQYATISTSCSPPCAWGAWSTSASGSCNWNPNLGSDPQGDATSDLTCTSVGATITATCLCANKCPPTVGLSFPTYDPWQGQSNTGTFNTSISGDEVYLCFTTSSVLAGPSWCVNGASGGSLVVGYTTFNYNTQSLAVGTYYFIACDESFWQTNPFMTDPCTGIYSVTVFASYTSSSTTTISNPTWTLTVQNGADCTGTTGEGGTFNTGSYEAIAGTCTCGSSFIMWSTTTGSGTCNWMSGYNQNYNPSFITCTASGSSITATCGCGSCAYTTTVIPTISVAYTTTYQSTTTHQSTTPRTTSTTTCPTC